MAYKSICETLKGKSDETERITALQSRSVQGEHDYINKGLVYGLLAGEDWMRILLMCSRDQFQIACATMKMLLPRLKEIAKGQQLLVSLMRLDTPAFTDLLLDTVRRFDCVALFKAELDWLASQPNIASLVFYKSLTQAIADANRNGSMVAEYISTALQIWQRCRDHCVGIGRDLMRLLGSLTEVPGLELIWNELSLSIGQPLLYWRILSASTNMSFHSILLNPEVETRLIFIVEQVPVGNCVRYLKWLIEPVANHSLPDVMRFLVHLRTTSRLTPRWKIAGWLLGLVCSPHTKAHLKQALIFDVLFPANPGSPGEQLEAIRTVMELMADSLNSKPELAEELLEFIMLSAELYDIHAKGFLIRNVKESFARAEAERLFPAIEELIKDERISFEVRSRLNEFYSEPCAELYSPLPLALEESLLVVQQEIIDFLGEAGVNFAQLPSMETLYEVLGKKPKLDEEFAGFVLKVLSYELIVLPNIEFQDSFLWNLFLAAELDLVLKELVGLCEAQDASFAMMLLIYSVKTQSKLYVYRPEKLLRDIKASLNDFSLNTLTWLMPKVFEQSSQSISLSMLHFFLQVATPDLMRQVEADLLFKKYKLFEHRLEAVVQSSQDYAHSEQLYLWKLIVAEVAYDQAEDLLNAFAKLSDLKAAWEAKSGFQQFFSLHGSSVDIAMAKKLIALPSKVLAQSISLILLRVKPTVVRNTQVEGAVVEALHSQSSSFQVQTNKLRHLMHWQMTVLRGIVSAKSVQDALTEMFQGLSSECLKEFGGLLDPALFRASVN